MLFRLCMWYLRRRSHWDGWAEIPSYNALMCIAFEQRFHPAIQAKIVHAAHDLVARIPATQGKEE